MRTKATKSQAKPSAGSSHLSSNGKRKWSASVTSDSTSPPEGLFNRDAATIARSLASKRVSPKGPASGMRMLTFYINRAGKNLSEAHLKELKKATTLLHQRIEKAKAG